MTLKVAIVGCGKIADGHVGEIQKLPKLARVVAVCDTEPLMAEQLANRFDIAGIYDDFSAMLTTERPDVVHIATPPRSHLSLATEALAAGCHIYVEKPLAPEHSDTVKLVERARDTDRKLTAGYSYLFDPPARQLRQLVADGALGEIVHLETFYGYDLTGPFGSAVLADANHWVHGLPGQLLQNNIDHMLYKLAEYIDDDEPDLTAFGMVRRPQRFGDKRDVMADELRVLLRGRRVTATATFSSFSRPIAHVLRLYGTRNSATVDFSARTVVLESTSPLPSALGRLVPAFQRSGRLALEGARNVASFARSEFHFFAGLNHLIRSFYESILDGGPAPIEDRTLLWTSAIMDRIFRALDAGGTADGGNAGGA